MDGDVAAIEVGTKSVACEMSTTSTEAASSARTERLLPVLTSCCTVLRTQAGPIDTPVYTDGCLPSDCSTNLLGWLYNHLWAAFSATIASKFHQILIHYLVIVYRLALPSVVAKYTTSPPASWNATRTGTAGFRQEHRKLAHWALRQLAIYDIRDQAPMSSIGRGGGEVVERV